MTDFIWYAFLTAALALLVVGGAWVVRGLRSGTSPRAAIFGPRPDPRLAVVEHAHVDGRRRLVLIRRDGIEHLIMTGGPVDVVIETGIGQPAPARRDVSDAVASMPVFTRAPRTLGAGSEKAAE